MYFTDILNRFRSGLPLVALHNNIAESLSTVEVLKQEVAVPLDIPVYVWDEGRGLREIDAGIQSRDRQQLLGLMEKPGAVELMDIFKHLEDQKPDGLFIFSNLSLQNSTLIQVMQNLFFSLRSSKTRLLFFRTDLPTGLGEIIPSFEVPLPGRVQVMELIQSWVQEKTAAELDEETLTVLARAGQGLSPQEIEDALLLAHLSDGFIDIETAKHLNKGKIDKLKQYQVTFMDKPDTPIGGLDLLKNWLKIHTKLLDPQAQHTGIPFPKGIMLVGPPGSGKSMAAKTISYEWSIPCLQLDMSRIYSSGEGASERNFREILRIAEGVSPCVLWIDEAEKAFATGNEVSKRVFGMFLNWMQERTAPVFVVATVNRINELPPELTRKGRFDEIFFVDLPKAHEREEILRIHMDRFKLSFPGEKIQWLSENTEGFSGAELERIIVESVIKAYSEDSDGVTFEELKQVGGAIQPLAHSRQQETMKMELWGRRYARPSSTNPESDVNNGLRTKSSLGAY